jgi:hypothetical protein
MSHPAAEPAREQRINRAAVPRVGLFSHPPQAEVSAQCPAPVRRGDGSRWRATSFSSGTAEQRHTPRVDDEDQPAGHQRQPRPAPRGSDDSGEG